MKKGAFIHARRGFTLVELMVTLAVVAILAVIAAPALQSFAARSAMNSLEGDFTKALARARLDALSRNTCVTVCQMAVPATPGAARTCEPTVANRGNWHQGWIVFENAACTGTFTAGMPAAASIISVREPGNARYTLIDRSSTPDLLLTYNARGLLRAGNTTFDLADQQNQGTAGPNARTLVLNAQGRLASGPYTPPSSTTVATDATGG